MSAAADVDAAQSTLRSLWADLDGPPELVDEVEVTGPASVLSSIYDVTGFAAATVGAAALATAELWAARTGGPRPRTAVDRLAASASFRLDALLQTDGWDRPPTWDPVAGDYRAADGWIRLHTNYRHHRDAALAVLDAPVDRDAVAAAVARWSADDLEAAVVAQGGAAAAMRSEDEWIAHPAGLASATERPTTVGAGRPVPAGSMPDLAAPPSSAPLAGIRVLDLTRVIAGPVASRYLAAHGADVVRVDPPGFDEVPIILPELTAGKRCAALDLAAAGDRERFSLLVAQAHVAITGLRPGALDGLGFGPDDLRAINPALIVVGQDAYGWTGPWAGRRGFDSLVQMSSGIAAAGAAAAGVDRPTPLPAQALDHGTGHLLAAGACRALTRLIVDGEAALVQGSLIGSSNVVRSLPAPDGPTGEVTDADAPLEPGRTAWGPVRRVPLAGTVEGHPARWTVDAGPLGRHEARFQTVA